MRGYDQLKIVEDSALLTISEKLRGVDEGEIEKAVNPNGSGKKAEKEDR